MLNIFLKPEMLFLYFFLTAKPLWTHQQNRYRISETISQFSSSFLFLITHCIMQSTSIGLISFVHAIMGSTLIKIKFEKKLTHNHVLCFGSPLHCNCGTGFWRKDIITSNICNICNIFTLSSMFNSLLTESWREERGEQQRPRSEKPFLLGKAALLVFSAS